MELLLPTEIELLDRLVRNIARRFQPTTGRGVARLIQLEVGIMPHEYHIATDTQLHDYVVKAESETLQQLVFVGKSH